VWTGHPLFALSGVSTARVYPLSTEHRFSLLYADRIGALDVQMEGGQPTVALWELEDVIGAERATPSSATEASYDQWPWEVEYDTRLAAEPGDPGVLGEPSSKTPL
jgi:hypothetical protein